MDIQTEVQKIHHKFGISEKANYEIQKLFDRILTELLSRPAVTDEERLKKLAYNLAENLITNYDKRIAVIKGIKEYFSQEDKP